jgi:hydroxyethylthiazole kinase-like sugar kinase family protein
MPSGANLKPNEAKSGRARQFKAIRGNSSQVKPSAESQVKSSQVKASQGKSSQIKSSQVKASQVKARQVKASGKEEMNSKLGLL